jgi:hypothetical protein
MLKYSSLFFSAASSLIHWILLLWLGVSLEDTYKVLEPFRCIGLRSLLPP